MMIDQEMRTKAEGELRAGINSVRTATRSDTTAQTVMVCATLEAHTQRMETCLGLIENRLCELTEAVGHLVAAIENR